jgi:hypothetical protein
MDRANLPKLAVVRNEGPAYRRWLSHCQDQRDAELMHAFTHRNSKCGRCLEAIRVTEPIRQLRESLTAKLMGHGP